MAHQQTRSKSKHLINTTLFALITSVAPASADKLDDFRTAVANGGCDSIPYSDLRSACRSQQDEVHPWCNNKVNALEHCKKEGS